MFKLQLGQPLSTHLDLVLQSFHLVKLSFLQQLSSLFYVIYGQVALIVSQVIYDVLEDAAVPVYENDAFIVDVEVNVLATVNNFPEQTVLVTHQGLACRHKQQASNVYLNDRSFLLLGLNHNPIFLIYKGN